VSLKGDQGAVVPAPVGQIGEWGMSVWLVVIDSSRVDASLGALRCSLSLELSVRWRFSHHINTGDGR